MPEATLPNNSQEPAPRPLDVEQRRDAVSRPVMVALTALFVVVGYVQSLSFGLWFDDHAHFLHLKEKGWSHQDAVEAAYLAVPGEVMDYWGRSEPLIRYYRPVAFTLMKIEYIIGGWRPEVMHGFSMAWHFICALLVGSLTTRFLGSRTWGTVGACLMAIHPAHVGTVSWIACQTELMTTAFQLMAILAYSRHARWGERFVYLDDSYGHRCRAWFTGRPPATPLASETTPDSARPAVTPAIIAALLLFALALGCRENAVMFPVVCWIGDRFCGAGRRKWIRWEHIAMAVMVVVYLGVRHWSLQGFYSLTWQRMAGLSHWEMARFMLDKPVVYMLGIFSYIPIMPGVTVGQIDGAPATFYALALLLVVVFLIVWKLLGWGPAMIWPVAVMFLTMAPTIPIYPSAHHLYLPSIGGIILMTTLFALLGGMRLPHGQRLTRRRKRILGVVLILNAICLSAVTWWRGYAIATGAVVDKLFVEEVIQRTPGMRAGDHFFFINMPPLAALYPSCSLRIRTGLPEAYAHTLTYAPYVIRMEAPASIEVLGTHRLRVKAHPEVPFLRGLAGQITLSMLGLPKPKTGDQFEADLDSRKIKRGQQGEVTTGDRYTVVIKDADAKGVYELEFIFNKPLSSPEYHFYFGSPQFLAYPLDVSKLSRLAAEPTATETAPGTIGTPR